MSDDKSKVLFEAMEKDDKLIEKEISELTSLASTPIKVRVKIGEREVVIMARRFKDSEISSYLRAQNKINPALEHEVKASDITLTAEESDQLYTLMDEYIALATKIPKDKLAEIGSVRIRHALFKGIFYASVPSPEEVADIRKFRPDE